MKVKPRKKWRYPFSMEREYQRFMRDLVKEINTIIQEEMEEIKSIVQEKSLFYKTDGIGDRIINLIKRIKEKIKSNLSERFIKKKLKDIAFKTSYFNLNQFKNIVKSVFAVDIVEFEPWLDDLIDVWIGENVRLIKSIESEYFSEVERIVRQGWQEGVSTKEITKDLNKKFNLSNKRAQRIARDQMGKLNGQVTEYRQRDAGIEEYEWLTCRDSRVRDSHIEREGKIYRWDNPPCDGHPGIPIQCRCVAQPVLNLDKINFYGVKPKRNTTVNIK